MKRGAFQSLLLAAGLIAVFCETAWAHFPISVEPKANDGLLSLEDDSPRAARGVGRNRRRLLALLVLPRIRRAFRLPRSERDIQCAALFPPRICHESRVPSILCAQGDLSWIAAENTSSPR